MGKRIVVTLSSVVALAVLITMGSVWSGLRGQERRNLLFIQQDKVIAFNPATGIGAQVGTATGRINGATTVNFQFTITSFPNFSFDNRAGITDTDGDQVIFKNIGTGRFILPPLVDGSSPLGTVFSLGGPLTGTYQAVAATGKYQGLLGKTFPYRAVAMNPAEPGSLGSVYVEVFSNEVH